MDTAPLGSGALKSLAPAAIEPHLPKNQPGARRVDDQRVISGIIHMLKCGGRWADCPSEYGPSKTVYNGWNRWSRRGIWTGILVALTEEGWLAETGQIDSSYVEAPRFAGGAKGGRGPMPLGARRGPNDRKRPVQYDERRYKDRWRVETMFCRLKDFRRVATRYDKLARNFLSAVSLAAAVAFWL
ncbi:transposase [Altererythrobacter rubellus]|uniref:transposase n=1 Tax=Altererythrobacter rubellus TaxID=2173831 RepID=UPI003D80B33E